MKKTILFLSFFAFLGNSKYLHALNPCTIPNSIGNYTSGKFSNQDCQGRDFSGYTFEDCDFKGSNLNNCKFLNTKIINNNFEGASLQSCQFNNNVIYGNNFKKADLSNNRDPGFQGFDFSNRNRPRYNINRLGQIKPKYTAPHKKHSSCASQFTQKKDCTCYSLPQYKTTVCTEHEGTNFEGANLSNCTFIGSILTGSSFKNAIAQNSDFSTAAMNCINASDADFTGSNFTNSDLEFSNWQNSNLNKTNFFSANLSNANLENADISDAIFVGTDLCHANLLVKKQHAYVLHPQNQARLFPNGMYWPTKYCCTLGYKGFVEGESNGQKPCVLYYDNPGTCSQQSINSCLEWARENNLEAVKLTPW